jgi:hypothetical protein
LAAYRLHISFRNF